jgi:hypothetical protein
MRPNKEHGQTSAADGTISKVKESEQFEQQIHRIHELLDGSDATVIWDERVHDPDNPRQSRQIDITIRRKDKLTIVECRQHQTSQDVQWIEELIGRRVSLQADGVIAVSSTGFTAGARMKARAHGIFLRELQELTESEIRSWGQQVALTLYFYQYSDLDVSLYFDRNTIHKLDHDVLASKLKTHPAMQSLFQAAAQKLGTINLMAEEHQGTLVAFGLRLELFVFQVCDEQVLEVDFRGNARLISREVISPAVFAYGQPGRSPGERDACIEKFSLGETSIVHEADKLSIFLDVSHEVMPPFCQFRFFRLGHESEMEHASLELLGLEKLWVHGKGLKVNICSK